jgi:hypothetical protein
MEREYGDPSRRGGSRRSGSRRGGSRTGRVRTRSGTGSTRFKLVEGLPEYLKAREISLMVAKEFSNLDGGRAFDELPEEVVNIVPLSIPCGPSSLPLLRGVVPEDGGQGGLGTPGKASVDSARGLLLHQHLIYLESLRQSHSLGKGSGSLAIPHIQVMGVFLASGMDEGFKCEGAKG